MKDYKFVDRFVFYRNIAIITDANFWIVNERDIIGWLEKNTRDGKHCQQGMTLEFANDKEKLWFTLRWMNNA